MMYVHPGSGVGSTQGSILDRDGSESNYDHSCSDRYPCSCIFYNNWLGSLFMYTGGGVAI